MGSPPTEPERIRRKRASIAHANPPPVRHRRQGGDGRAVPAVLEGGITIDRYQRSPSFLKQVQPRSRRSDGSVPTGTRPLHYCNWLSEQEGLPKDQWCYHPQRGRGLRRGDDDPCRRPDAGLSPAHRGGMGIRLPGGCDHQPLLRSLDRPALTLMLGIRPTARSMPGRAAACCPTTWGCSTCWETCLNGVRTRQCSEPETKGISDDAISISEYCQKKTLVSFGAGRSPSAGDRPLGVPSLVRPGVP